MRFLSFNELVPNGHVTVTEDNKLFAVELVMVVMEKTRDDAGWVIRNLPEELFPSVNFTVKATGGRGNGRTKLVTFEHAIELIMVLPGKTAKEYRQKFVDVIKRYLAGDQTLIGEIQANAASDAPVNKMAREACAAEPPQSTEDVCMKRKRDQLEYMQVEMEMKYTAIEKYRALCTGGVMDERAKVMFKDSLLNSTLICGGVPTCSSEDTTPISISQMGAKLGYHLSGEEYKKVGKIAGRLYREQHGAGPSKHTQLVNGQAIEVNTYFAKDGELVKKAFEEYTKDTSAPAGPQSHIDKCFSKKARV